VWFVVHLLESLRRVRPELAASLCQVLEEHGDDASRYVLTSLIDEIHEKDDRIALVIDDWQRVSDAETTAALCFLLEHGCHHLQVIVTSWSRAGLPMSKLRIQDELVEIDGGSLRFDTDEAQSFFNDIGGLQLPGSDVEALTRSTDGGPLPCSWRRCPCGAAATPTTSSTRCRVPTMWSVTSLPRTSSTTPNPNSASFCLPAR